ncbi:MAG TPA: hemerythrin domain-containing protein [Leucothrix mucor]|nr:hemerythrin domain-containing protein [Leucothrix mucor]
MISIDSLQEQNHKIAELSNVLEVLLKNRELCDTQVTCDMFFSYVDLVKDHLQLEDRNLYQPMLTHSDSSVKKVADQFMTGSTEIKRVFDQYLKKWSRKNTLRIKNHDKFISDTSDMFELVWRRIVDETEHLYPVVRKIT